MGSCLVTGVTGQDGWYLSELLLAAGHTVWGVRSDTDSAPVPEGVQTVQADLRDWDSLVAAVAAAQPDQIYNLAALSSVSVSWTQPDVVADVNGTGVIRLLRAASEWSAHDGRSVAFVQAGSSEIFGDTAPAPQSERTPLRPNNPYGLAKTTAHEAVRLFRVRGMRASNVVLYNHESPRRPAHFVTRRITQGVARIAAGRADALELGDLAAVRDWGYAQDYMRALILAAEHPTPGDWVVATGHGRTVQDFVATAFSHAGLDDWARYVRVDPGLVRPAEQHVRVGDASLARRELGWRPTIDFAELVALMMDNDLELEHVRPNR